MQMSKRELKSYSTYCARNMARLAPPAELIWIWWESLYRPHAVSEPSPKNGRDLSRRNLTSASGGSDTLGLARFKIRTSLIGVFSYRKSPLLSMPCLRDNFLFGPNPAWERCPRTKDLTTQDQTGSDRRLPFIFLQLPFWILPDTPGAPYTIEIHQQGWLTLIKDNLKSMH
jgi:hypothetical protein